MLFSYCQTKRKEREYHTMFHKKKLRQYLLTVFTIIILLTSIITIVNISGLYTTHRSTQDLMNTTVAAEIAVKNCRLEANIAARNLREMVITKDAQKLQTLKEDVHSSVATIEQQIEIFKSTHGTEDGLAQKYEDAFRSWFGIAEKVIAAVDANQMDKASSIITKECSPALANLASIVKDIDRAMLQEREDKNNSANTLFFSLLTISIVSFIAAVAASIIFALKTTKNIVDGTQRIMGSVEALARGDLDTHIDYQAKNEFGELAEHMNFSMQEMSKYIHEIDAVMTSFAEGDFSTKSDMEFLGDFAHIQQSIQHFQANMNRTLLDLQTNADQVNIGSSQVAMGAQTLAQGATEQAQSLQDLSTSIADITEQITVTAEYSQDANRLGGQASEVINQSKTEMQQMGEAIQNISKSSESIQKIIKVIDDIAFQTNVLALNAAVEAARAGSAGKGFAVVADEVRNLAQKSATAAKETTELIENSLQQITYGEELVGRTETAFADVTKYAEEIIAKASSIAEASAVQSSSIQQISSNVNQISSVVQTTSATAEQSAAASEELNGQAEMMKVALKQFKFLQDYTTFENPTDIM